MKEKIKVRMNNPEDTFMKRQFTYLGEIAHELYNLPGEYVGSECNEYPNVDGGIPRADIVYGVKIKDKTFMINIEDETSYVNEETLQKSFNYQNNIYYKTKNPVISVITTTIHEDKCLKKLLVSPTLSFKPLIFSFPSKGTWKKLNSLINKAKDEKVFSDVEGLKLINLVRCCPQDQDKAIELVCSQLFNLKIENEYVKNELIYSMQCLIHKYAKTDKDIIRLERMIGLKQTMKKRNSVLEAMERQGILKGEKKGRKEGRKEGMKEGEVRGTLNVLKDLVNDPSNDYTVEDLAKKYGFSVDEILNANMD